MLTIKKIFLCSDVIFYLLACAHYLLVDEKLDMIYQCTPTSQKFNCILSYNKGMPRRLRKEILPHYSTFVRSHLEGFIYFWGPQVQRTTTKTIRGMGHPSYVEMLRELEMFRLDIRKKPLTMRVVKQWNKFSREVVVTLFLYTLKVGQDSEQTALVEDGPFHSGGLD